MCIRDRLCIAQHQSASPYRWVVSTGMCYPQSEQHYTDALVLWHHTDALVLGSLGRYVNRGIGD
eukprot:3576203-Rhodomonas_salina.1